MAVVVTSIGRVRDWRAFEQFGRDALVERARAAGARRCRVYRNVRDASQVLIVAELPDHDAVHELGRDLDDYFHTLLVGGTPDERVWELTGIAGFES